MSATVTQVKTALATALGGISGVRRIYTTAPNSLPPSDLPAFVIYSGGASYPERGATINDGEVRTYALRLHVLPMQEGIPGEAEATCDVFFARVRAVFPTGYRLNRLAGVLAATLTGDSGIGIFQLGGSTYMGIEFTLEVTQ